MSVLFTGVRRTHKRNGCCCCVVLGATRRTRGGPRPARARVREGPERGEGALCGDWRQQESRRAAMAPPGARHAPFRAPRMLSASPNLEEWQQVLAAHLESRVNDAAHLALEVDIAEQRLEEEVERAAKAEREAEQLRAERDAARAERDAARAREGAAADRHESNLRMLLGRVQDQAKAEQADLKRQIDALRTELKVKAAKADLDLALARELQAENRALKQGIPAGVTDHMTSAQRERTSEPERRAAAQPGRAGPPTGADPGDGVRASSMERRQPRTDGGNGEPSTPEGTTVSEAFTSVVPFSGGAGVGAAPACAGTMTSPASAALQREGAEALVALQSSRQSRGEGSADGQAAALAELRRAGSVAMPARARRSSGPPARLKDYHSEVTGAAADALQVASAAGAQQNRVVPVTPVAPTQATPMPGEAATAPATAPGAAEKLMALACETTATASGGAAPPTAGRHPPSEEAAEKASQGVARSMAAGWFPAATVPGASGAGTQHPRLRRNARPPKRFQDETHDARVVYEHGCAKCRGSRHGCVECNPAKRQKREAMMGGRASPCLPLPALGEPVERARVARLGGRKPRR